MHETSVITPKKLIQVIEKKGFVLDRVKGSHHMYIHPDSRQRIIIPLHTKELPKGTLLEIVKQAGIKKEELVDL